MTINYLHVIHSLHPRWGGPGEGVKQLARSARSLGQRVEIATFEPVSEELARQYDCPVHYVGPAFFKYGYARQFRSWLDRNAARFDAVVVNGIWQYHSYCVWQALRNSPIPYYVFTHGMLDPWFRRRYPLKHLKKLLYWPWAEYRVLRDARAVLFTTEEERQLARGSFSLYRANEVVVGYGIQAPPENRQEHLEAFLDSHPELKGKRCFLFLGRLHEKKGCDLLIEAFAQVAREDSSLRLVIAGPDERGLRSSLSSRAERLGIAHAITWTGLLQGSLKIGAIAAAEVLVLPSHQENFGIVVAEALACGVPVLVSNRVNIWREVVEDHAGLVADDTVPGTTRMLRDWLDMSAAGRERVARNARECFKRRFQSDIAARNLLAVIERGGLERRRVA